MSTLRTWHFRPAVASAAVWLVAAALTICGAAAARAAVDFPDTEAGKRAEAYVEAFNTGKQETVTAFAEANFSAAALQARPMQERIAVYEFLKNDLATLEPMKITTPGEDKVTVIAKAATGKWVELSFTFEPQSPYKIVSVGFRLLPEAPDLDQPTTALSQEAMIAELGAYLSEAAAGDRFSGAVLVAKHDVPIFREAYGLASKEYDVPNRVDTRFNLGSINKYLTEIAIEQLAGKGLLSLDDAIGEHLAAYPNKDAAGKVTIRHLLDMQSGIGDFFGERYDATPKDQIRNLADYLPLFAEEPLLFEPGTDTRYSNGGFVVLGLIIESVSGGTYFDYVRDNIYKVAGMNDSGHLEADVPIGNVASGYTTGGCGGGDPSDTRRNNIYTRPARGSSAGGGYSTVDDLLRLVGALKAGKLAAPEAAERIRQGGIALAGGAPGINGHLAVTAGDYVIVVLSNYDPPTAQTVGRRIEDLLARVED